MNRDLTQLREDGVAMFELALVIFLVGLFTSGLLFLFSGVKQVNERAHAADAMSLSLGFAPQLLITEQGVTRPAEQEDLNAALQSFANFAAHNANQNVCAGLFRFARSNGSCVNPEVDGSGDPEVLSAIRSGGGECDPKPASCPGLYEALREQCNPRAAHLYYMGLCFPDQPSLGQTYLAARPASTVYSSSTVNVGGAATSCQDFLFPNFNGNQAECCPPLSDCDGLPPCSSCVDIGTCEASELPCCPEGSVCHGNPAPFICEDTSLGCAFTTPSSCNQHGGYPSNNLPCCPGDEESEITCEDGIPFCSECAEQLGQCNDEDGEPTGSLCCKSSDYCHDENMPLCDPIACPNGYTVIEG